MRQVGPPWQEDGIRLSIPSDNHRSKWPRIPPGRAQTTRKCRQAISAILMTSYRRR